MLPLVVLVILFLFLVAPLGWHAALRVGLAGMLLLTASAHWGKRRADLIRLAPAAFPRPEQLVRASHTEGLFALSCGTRTEVDDMVRIAVAAGGKHAMEPQDHGFMYGSSFYDPDGHHWEVVWMDENAMPA